MPLSSSGYSLFSIHPAHGHLFGVSKRYTHMLQSRLMSPQDVDAVYSPPPGGRESVCSPAPKDSSQHQHEIIQGSRSGQRHEWIMRRTTLHNLKKNTSPKHFLDLFELAIQCLLRSRSLVPFCFSREKAGAPEILNGFFSDIEAKGMTLSELLQSQDK